MMRSMIAFTVAASLLAGCAKPAPSPLLGTLEWERIAVAGEASEPILRIDVAEGVDVRAGDAILSLDPKRTNTQVEQASA